MTRYRLLVMRGKPPRQCGHLATKRKATTSQMRPPPSFESWFPTSGPCTRFAQIRPEVNRHTTHVAGWREGAAPSEALLRIEFEDRAAPGAHVDVDRVAAHLAVLDVALIRNACIDEHRDRLPTVWTVEAVLDELVVAVLRGRLHTWPSSALGRRVARPIPPIVGNFPTG